MKKRIFFAISLIVLVYSCSELQVQNYDKVFQYKGQPPVIVDYYAPEAIRPGITWKIYLRGEDQDGDMEYVATMLYQEGFGYYATDYARLEGKDRKKFAGYISLRTPSDMNLTSDKFTMEIILRDSRTNQSETVHLPLSFGYVERAQIPPEWQVAAKNRLGTLVTRIRSMEIMIQGSGS